MKVVLDLVYKMNATQKEELKEISPSDLGLEWDMCDAVLDALTDREEEFKRNPNLTTEVFKWYSQNANRYYYADDAISEFGYDKDGGIVKALQMGIYKCLEEFAYAGLKDEEE